MKKLFAVAWKDVRLTFRDSSALIMMLATPFALTLAIAFAFGGLGGSGPTLNKIPLVVVNHDGGQFGQIVVDVFMSEDLADLLDPTIVLDDASARSLVDGDKATAVVIIPRGFSERVLATSGAPSVVEVYRHPTRAISAGVVQGIVEQIIGRLAAGVAGGQVAVTQLAMSGALPPQQAMSQGQQIAQRVAAEVSDTQLITLASETATRGNGSDFNWLLYMVPSTAIMFLMFTVTSGGRSLLAERDGGTLPRLLSTPTSAAHIVGGKVAGIYLTGLLQMGILLTAGTLLFGIDWAAPLAVALLTMALVAAATGWGAVLAAYSRTASEANQLGTMVALASAMLAGNFMPRQYLPAWLRTAGYVTPNAWGLEGFNSLTAGGGLSDVTVPIVALLGLGAVLFVAALIAFRRQYA